MDDEEENKDEEAKEGDDDEPEDDGAVVARLMPSYPVKAAVGCLHAVDGSPLEQPLPPSCGQNERQEMKAPGEARAAGDELNRSESLFVPRGYWDPDLQFIPQNFEACLPLSKVHGLPPVSGGAGLQNAAGYFSCASLRKFAAP
jgi:hypothetical protein